MKTLITGATSGIGKALTLKLAHQGHCLTLVGRNKESLEELSHIPRAQTLLLDLSQEEERQKLLLWIAEEAPSLVINSAGFGFYGKALSHPIPSHRSLIEVNILALTEITLAAAAALQKRKETGTILNISSATSLFPFPLFATYAASKSFVTSFSRSLASELRPEGIHILVSCPGMVDTPFRSSAAGKPIPRPRGTLPLAKVVNRLLRQIEEKQPYTIIDWKMALFSKITHILPRSFLDKLLAGTIANRL